MKFFVTISFEIESKEYHKVKPTEDAVHRLVKDMLYREADLPEKVDIKVEKEENNEVA